MKQKRFLGDGVRALGFCFSSHSKDVVLVELAWRNAADEAAVVVNASLSQAEGHRSC